MLFENDFAEEGIDEFPNLLKLLKEFGARNVPPSEGNPMEIPRTQAPSPEELIEANISNQARKQELDKNISAPPSYVNPPQQFSLEDIYKLNSKAEGMDAVPGTQSMSSPGNSGRFGTQSSITPEGQRATNAASLLRQKGRYGGAGSETLNAGENIAALGRQAFLAGAPERRRKEAQIASIQDMIERALVAGGNQTNTPRFEELQTQLAGLKGLQANQMKSDTMSLEESAGDGLKSLAPLLELHNRDRQHQEFGQLAQMLSPGGNNIPSTMSKDTFSTLQKVLSGQREDRRLANADRSFDALQQNRQQTREDRNNRQVNPSAAMVKLKLQSYLPPGTNIARFNGQDLLVKTGTNTPVPNGEMYIRTAIQKAQQEMSGKQGNPAITQHPAIKGVEQMLRAEKEGTLALHQAILLQRFKQNQLKVKQELMKQGLDERSAAEQANLLAAGDVVGMR